MGKARICDSSQFVRGGRHFCDGCDVGMVRSISLLKLRNVAGAFLDVAEARVGHLD